MVFYSKSAIKAVKNWPPSNIKKARVCSISFKVYGLRFLVRQRCNHLWLLPNVWNLKWSLLCQKRKAFAGTHYDKKSGNFREACCSSNKAMSSMHINHYVYWMALNYIQSLSIWQAFSTSDFQVFQKPKT